MASPAGNAAPRKWTPAEDRRLQIECEQQLRSTGAINDWMAVADKIPYRTNKDCRKRWSKICATLKKGPWDSDEDARLQQGVAQHGFKWTLVAQVVHSRSADQCAKRWQHSLDPQLDRSEWKTEEDRALLEAVRQYGQSWTSISQAKFPRRSKTDIKNRYSILLRRLQQRPSYLPSPSETPDYEEDDEEESDGEMAPSYNPQANAQYMNYAASSSHHGAHPAMQYDHSMSQSASPVPPYLSPDYRSASNSSGSGTSSPPTPAGWGQHRGSINQYMMAPSASAGSSGDFFGQHNQASMMDPMAMGQTTPGLTDDEFTSGMIAQMSGMEDPQMYMGSPGVDGMAAGRPGSTLTITIEDADPNHIDGITSMLLRSKSKFRMQQS